MTNEVLQDAQRRMKAVIEVMKKDLTTIRTGRANPALLDRVMVEYYGTPTPLNQLANISAPDPRLLVVQPWDKSALKEVEKALIKADLGMSPNVDGDLIRLPIPQLTEERRKEMVKIVRKSGEEKRVAIRNIRRDCNDRLKTLEKNGELPEDDSRRAQDEVQKLTDQFIAEIDNLIELKEKELMEI
ncbi:MAG: ribosome recycling factor [Limnochordia bacterium]|jgi:ribosome recycling factor